MQTTTITTQSSSQEVPQGIEGRLAAELATLSIEGQPALRAGAATVVKSRDFHCGGCGAG